MPQHLVRARFDDSPGGRAASRKQPAGWRTKASNSLNIKDYVLIGL